MPLNILLAGEESAGVQILRELLKSEHRLVAVMASPSSPAGPSSVWSVAQKMGCNTWPAKLVKDPALAERIRAEGVDLLLNAHSLFIIRPEVLAAPRLGAYNLHPGPLPRYAGLNAPSWAIYRGETTHGVTVHRMEPGIDTGPIAYQELFPIEPGETGLSLSMKCIKFGVPLMMRVVETAARDPGGIPALAQDFTQREYFGREAPENGCLRWNRPAREILNFVRACDYLPFRSPWGHPRARLGDREVAILKAVGTGERATAPPGTVGRAQESGFLVAAADEWIVVTSLTVNGQPAKPAAVLHTGDRLEDGTPAP